MLFHVMTCDFLRSASLWCPGSKALIVSSSRRGVNAFDKTLTCSVCSVVCVCVFSIISSISILIVLSVLSVLYVCKTRCCSRGLQWGGRQI